MLSITADACVVYWFTHHVALSAGIVLLLNTSGTVLYYVHERVWAHVPWGSTTKDNTP